MLEGFDLYMILKVLLGYRGPMLRVIQTVRCILSLEVLPFLNYSVHFAAVHLWYGNFCFLLDLPHSGKGGTEKKKKIPGLCYKVWELHSVFRKNKYLDWLIRQVDTMRFLGLLK